MDMTYLNHLMFLVPLSGHTPLRYPFLLSNKQGVNHRLLRSKLEAFVMQGTFFKIQCSGL